MTVVFSVSPLQRWRRASGVLFRRTISRLYIAEIVAAIFLCAPALAFGQNINFDWNQVFQEIQSSVTSKSNQTEEFSKQLEKWYSELGIPIKIDMPRENFGYMLALVAAASPDFDPEKLRLPDGFKPKTRYDLFQYMAKKVDCQSIPFDKTKWLSLREASADRYKMIKSFLRDRGVIGATAADIKKELGIPTSDSEETLSYLLGPDTSTLGPDSVWIYFYFKNGAVSEYSYRGE